MASKKMKLDAFEQSIEDAFERGETRPVVGKELERLMSQVKEASANLRKGIGGARPGAGRKPLGHVPTLLNLTPEARANLLKEAGGNPRRMSAVVNRVFGAKARRVKV